MLASLFTNVVGWNLPSNNHPGPIGRRVNAVLVALTHRACVHPIYTIGFFAILASTTYLTLIESTLFNRGDVVFDSLGKIDFNYMLKGSKQLYAGPQTDWKWTVEASDVKADEVRALFDFHRS
jgi:hydroxymethylglutaryl-CoA reductase (NADPH)